MKEPIVLINGVSTERDKEIRYTGNSIIDAQLLKTKIIMNIVSYTQNRVPFGIISYSMDSVPDKVYSIVQANADYETIAALTNILFYKFQYNNIYIKWDEIFGMISRNVNYNPTQNHQ